MRGKGRGKGKRLTLPRESAAGRAEQPSANAANAQQHRPGYSNNGVRYVISEEQVKGAVNRVLVKVKDIFDRLQKVEGQAKSNSHKITKLAERTQKASNAATKAMENVRKMKDKPKKPRTPEEKYNDSRADLKLMEKMKGVFVEDVEPTDEIRESAKNMFKANLGLVYSEFVKAGLRPRLDQRPTKEEALTYKHKIVGYFDDNGDYVVVSGEDMTFSMLHSACEMWEKYRSNEDFNKCLDKIKQEFGHVQDQTKRNKNMVQDPSSKKKVDPTLVFYNLVFLMGVLFEMWRKGHKFHLPKQIEVFVEAAEEETDTRSESDSDTEEAVQSGEGEGEGVGEGDGDGKEAKEEGGGGGKGGGEGKGDGVGEGKRDGVGEGEGGGEGQGPHGEPQSSMFMGSQLRQLQARLAQL